VIKNLLFVLIFIILQCYRCPYNVVVQAEQIALLLAHCRA